VLLGVSPRAARALLPLLLFFSWATRAHASQEAAKDAWLRAWGLVVLLPRMDTACREEHKRTVQIMDGVTGGLSPRCYAQAMRAARRSLADPSILSDDPEDTFPVSRLHLLGASYASGGGGMPWVLGGRLCEVAGGCSCAAIGVAHCSCTLDAPHCHYLQSSWLSTNRIGWWSFIALTALCVGGVAWVVLTPWAQALQRGRQQVRVRGRCLAHRRALRPPPTGAACAYLTNGASRPPPPPSPPCLQRARRQQLVQQIRRKQH